MARITLLLVCLTAPAFAQGTQISIPPWTSTFSAGLTRGLWFTAPVDFTIVGLRVPDEGMHGLQNVQVVTTPTPPPAYSATTTGTTLLHVTQQPSANIIPASIPITAGDHVGILGACGTGTMLNSYSSPGPFAAMIGSSMVNLNRFGTQASIDVNPATTFFTSSGAISRVEVYYQIGVSCSINSPAPAAMVSGVISIDYDVDEPMMLPADAVFEYSLDMGVTWLPATPGGMSSNPLLGIPTPSTGLIFEWDSVADSVGLLMPENADFRITVTEPLGMVMSDCTVDMLAVDNVPPPPTCTLAQTVPGTARFLTSFDFTPDSLNAGTVDATFEYSLDAGMTWNLATPGGASTNPLLAAPIMTLATFEWDSDADMVGQMAIAPGVILRATVDDGTPLQGECTTAPFDVDNTALCSGICGDCDLNGAGPDILDALTGAQVAAGLITPTMTQTGCCDVDSSMSVTVLDALTMAQAAAGLMPTVMCP